MTTIYGDYSAPAVSSRGGGRWHIEGDAPATALCGREVRGDLARMRLHVSLLECSKCMTLGEPIYSNVVSYEIEEG
jgi:hypothetical protein